MAMAKIIEHSLRLSKQGNLMATATFMTSENKKLMWFGSLKEGKAREITLKTLETIGVPKNALSKLNDGILQVNPSKVFELVTEQAPDEKGEVRTRIKYINDPESPRSQAPEINKDEVMLALSQSTIIDEYKAMTDRHQARADMKKIDEEIPF